MRGAERSGEKRGAEWIGEWRRGDASKEGEHIVEEKREDYWRGEQRKVEDRGVERRVVAWRVEERREDERRDD